MKRMATLTFCFATCLLLIVGCLSMTDNAKQPEVGSKTDDINLSVKIDIEKNGAPLDCFSSIVSKDTIAISHIIQERQENGSGTSPIIFDFKGMKITKLSADCYSMDYKIGIRMPIIVGNSKDSKSIQYVDIGSTSSINIKLGQSAYIFENNTYRFKMTIDAKK